MKAGSNQRQQEPVYGEIAWQSSTYGDHNAGLAVDQNVKSFAQTNALPTLRLDLKKNYNLQTIKIWTTKRFEEDGWYMIDFYFKIIHDWV